MKTTDSCNDRSWEQVFADMIFWKCEGEPAAWSNASHVGFMERTLKLGTGGKVLDLGCGLGHHSIEFAARGYDVTALEWSKPYLDAARQRADEAGVSVRFLQGDMTRMSFDSEFDAVVLWGNTFGMFSDEDNAKTLQGIARALRKGGSALIDTVNYITLPERLEKQWSFHDEDQSLLMLSEGTRDVLRARFGFTLTAIDLSSGKRHRLPMSWRLYLVPELRQLVAATGLDLVGIYGDDPNVVDWKNWKRGEPYPYFVEGFTEKAGKRILLCQRK